MLLLLLLLCCCYYCDCFSALNVGGDSDHDMRVSYVHDNTKKICGHGMQDKHNMHFSHLGPLVPGYIPIQQHDITMPRHHATLLLIMGRSSETILSKART